MSRILIIIALLLALHAKAAGNTINEHLKKAELYFEKGARYLALEELNQIKPLTFNQNPLFALRYHAIKAEIFYALSDMENMISEVHQYRSVCQKHFKNKEIYKSYYHAMYCKYYTFKASGDSLSFHAKRSLLFLKQNMRDATLIEAWYIYSAYANACRNVMSLAPPQSDPDVAAIYLDTAIILLKCSAACSKYKLARLYHSKASALLDLTTESAQNQFGIPFASKMYLKSVSLLSEAIVLYKQLSPKHPAIAQCLSLIALEEFYFSKFEQALKHFDEAEKLVTHQGLHFSINSAWTYASILRWKEWCLAKQASQPSEEELLKRILALKKAELNWQFQLFEVSPRHEDVFSDTYNLNPNSAIAENYFHLFRDFDKPSYLDSAYMYAEKQKYAAIAQHKSGITYSSEAFNKIVGNWHLQVDSLITGSKPTCIINSSELAVINKTLRATNDFERTHLSDLQKSIASDKQAILYYFINPLQSHSKLHVLSITKQKTELHILSTPHVLDNAIDLHSAFTKALHQADLSETKRTGHLYYKDYLEPSLKSLPEGTNQLILFPPTFMQPYPFNVFLTDTSGTNFKELSYLVKQYDLSYQLSGYTYLKSIDNSSQSPVQLTLWKCNYDGVLHNQIIHNQKLCEKLQNTFTTTRLDSNPANKKQFLYALQKSSVFHFSGHANGGRVINSLTNLYLNNDSVSIFDIYESDLSNNQLCVLNGCQSGTGKAIHTEGQNDFARAFTMQGSKSQILNKRKADDKSSAIILKTFYELMDKGYRKSEALAEAQREFLKNASITEANPIFWSSLFVNGNDSPIQIERSASGNKLLILSLAGGAILLFLLFKLFLKKKSRTI